MNIHQPIGGAFGNWRIVQRIVQRLIIVLFNHSIWKSNLERSHCHFSMFALAIRATANRITSPRETVATVQRSITADLDRSPRFRLAFGFENGSGCSVCCLSSGAPMASSASLVGGKMRGEHTRILSSSLNPARFSRSVWQFWTLIFFDLSDLSD